MTVVECIPIMKVWILLAFLIGYARGVDVTVGVGENATLVCPLAGTFPEWLGPPNQTPLTSNNQVTEAGMDYVNDKDLLILNVMTSQAGEYRCRSNGGEGVVKLIVNSFSYHVEIDGVRDKVVPYNPNTRVIPADVDTDFELMCVVSNAFPQPQVTLTMPGTSLTINPTTDSKMEANNTYTVTVKATISVTGDLDNKQVVCSATSGGNTVDTTETLRVVYKPLLHSYTSNGDLYGTRSSGRFECTSLKTWPLVDYDWSYNGGPLPDYFQKNATKCVQDSQTLRYECTSIVTAHNMSKENNGETLSCSRVFLGTKSATSHDFTISFLFPPTSATIETMGPITAKEGENITLTCSTDSANVLKGHEPTGKNIYESGVIFKWKVGTEYINFTIVSQADSPGNYNGFNATQTASFTVTKSMNGQKVVCQARNFYMDYNEHVEDMSAAMDISFAPILVMLPPSHRVYFGDSLNITCTVESNPDATVVWSFRGIDLQGTPGNVANSVTYSISPATTAAPGIYTCTAKNSMFPATTGETELQVLQKPPAPSQYVEYSAGGMASVIIPHSPTLPPTPIWYYVQYAAGPTGEWHEISSGVQDRADRMTRVPLKHLLPGTAYKVRIRVEQYGLSSYSGVSGFMTEEQEETKTDKEFRNAILISVFVTFGVMVIVLVLVVFLMKSKACGSSSTGDGSSGVYTDNEVFILLAFLIGYARGVDVTVGVGEHATLVCPLAGTFPEWVGPPNQTPLTSNDQVTETGLDYVNDKDLLILNVMTSQTGEYRCRSNGGEGIVKLIVNSFSYHVEIEDVRDNVVPYNSNTRVIPADVDTDFELVCVVSNAFPQPQVTLTMPETSLTINPTTDSKMEASNTYTVTAKANITVTGDQDNKQVVCSATSGGNTVDITETLRVVYRPLLHIYDSYLHSHGPVTFNCTSLLTWPLVDYDWLYNGGPLPDYVQKNATKCVQDSQNLRYNCTSIVTAYNLTREKYDDTVSCILSSWDQKAQQQVTTSA